MRQSKRRNLIGRKFNRLTVIEWDPQKTTSSKTAWLCKCDCGTIKSVRADHLTTARARSCGCLNKERMRTLNRTHGLSRSTFKVRFRNIQYRCNDPKSPAYPNYGAKGIKCLWLTFQDFVDDMYPSYLEHLKIHGATDTTIERIDVTGPYSKDNCRWATRKEQALNKNNTHWISFNGQTKPLGTWAEERGLKPGVIYARIKYYGWPIAEALTVPSGKRRLPAREEIH